MRLDEDTAVEVQWTETVEEHFDATVTVKEMLRAIEVDGDAGDLGRARQAADAGDVKTLAGVWVQAATGWSRKSSTYLGTELDHAAPLM